MYLIHLLNSLHSLDLAIGNNATSSLIHSILTLQTLMHRTVNKASAFLPVTYPTHT